MNFARKSSGFRLKPLALAMRQAGVLMFAAALAPGAAVAQVPTGGVVTQGSAAITNVSATQQLITQSSARAVINWQNFSIGNGSSVVFAQPGASSVVLNRVVSANPSAILGNLSANGQVFLVNPNGVYFGPNSVVDVTGIVATTHNISDRDFMAGRYAFGRDPQSPANASVINDGTIRAANGGYVVLAGDYAANNGIIEARLGTAILAAAGKFTLDITGDNLINFAIGEQTLAQLAGVSNTGQVLADGGRVIMTASVARDLSATVVNNTGLVQAHGMADRDGAIYLTADGGDVASSGRLDASGPRGGQVVVQAQSGTTLISGTVDASGSTGAGGSVQILGERVGLIDNASINASGGSAGGSVLIGGDFQGNNAAIQNAQRTYVGPAAQINADARDSGDGGKVIVWSDDITRYYGSISARGGAQSGNGGFAEVSGHRLLDFLGAADLSAAKGAAGTLLLDPLNITITNTAASNTTGFAPPGDQTEAFADDSATTSNFNVTAGTGSFAGVGAGTTIALQATNDITVSNAFNIATATGQSNVSLNLQANNNITLNAGVTASGTGTLTITADADHFGGGQISGAGVLTQAAGTLTLNAGSGINASTSAPVISFSNTSGAVSISNSLLSGVSVSGTNSGTVSITETLGALAVGAPGISTGGNTIGLTAAGAIIQAGTLAGTTLTTSSVGGTALNGGNTVTGFNATNTSSGNIALTDTAAPLTITGISQTGGGDATVSNSGAVNITGAISTAANGAVSVTANSGTLTVGNTVTAGGSGNITLASSGANNIAVNAAVGTTTGSIFLNSGGAITGGGTVTASGLALKTGTGSIGSSGSPLAVAANNFAAQSAGGVFVSKAAGALTVGGVALGGLNGITAAVNNDIKIQATGLTVAQNVTTSGTGTITLGAGTGTLASNSGANISAPAGVTLTGDDFTLDPASATSAAGGIVTLLQNTNGRGFSLGAGATAGTAGLSQGELQTITASTLRIGNNQTGAIAVDGNLTLLASEGALSLTTNNAAITQTAGTALVTPGGFAAQTGSGSVTLGQSGNSLKTVAINTTGNVSLGSSDAFTIAKVDGVTGISGNNVTLTTGQTTTGGITTGTATLTVASATGLAANDRVVIAGADAGGTDLITSIVSVVGNTITLAANANTTVAGATVTRLATTGTVAAGSSSLTVASGSGLSVNDRIIIPGAGSNGADLTTTITGISGTSLTLASAAVTGVTNAFIAKPSFIGGPTTVTTGGSINSGATTLTVASAGGFAIGDAIGVAGAGSSGDLKTTITAISGNTLTLHDATGTTVSAANVYHTDEGIAATGTVTLNSVQPSGFAATGGSLTASNLLLKGYGPFALNGGGLPNRVTGQFAADVTGNISYVDNAGLTIGSVGGTNGVTTHAMLVSPATTTPAKAATYTSANISISTNAAQTLATDAVALQINQPITAGAKNPVPLSADPALLTSPYTGQLLLFLVGDTKAVGSGLLQAGLLNLSANLAQGTFGDAVTGLTANVGSLLLTGSKNANIDNSAYSGLLTVFSLGQRDVAVTGTASSAATTTIGGQQVSTLTDNSQTFVVGSQAGRQIKITGGTDNGDIATVVNNDAHTLTLTSNWATIPDSTSTYQIGQNQDSRAGNIALKTGGAMQVASINNTGDLGLTSAGAQTITLLTSTGQNLLFRADALNISAAFTTPGVNVILQPYTTTNTIGINNATGGELPHASTTGAITLGTQTLTVASSAGLAVGDPITIAGAGAGGANLATSIISIAGTTIMVNDAAATTVAAAAVNDAAVGTGGTNYSATLLGKFNPQANIYVGGDSLTTPIGITGTPVLSGNVFIGNDGAVNLGTQNLFVSTTGNIVAHDIGTVHNMSLVAGGAGGITLNAFNSTGTNLLFKADAFGMPGAPASYASAAGVNVTLSPYTLSNVVGVHDAIDYTTYTPGSIIAGSNVLAVNSTAGFAVTNAIVVTGAGAGGNTSLAAHILAMGQQVTLGTNAGTTGTSVAVTITPALGAPVNTTGTVQAGTNNLILPAGTSVNAGDNIKVTGAGAAGADLLTIVSTVGAPAAMLLDTVAVTTANTVLVGLQSTLLPTISPNYPVSLLTNFNGTANITVGGTDAAHKLTGDVHIGSDVTPAAPFNIGTQTVTIATTGAIINHLAPLVSFPTSSNGSVPPTYTWTAGQTPTTGTGSTGGSSGGGSGGGGSGSGGGGSGSGSGSGPGTAGPSGNPSSGATGAATGTGNNGTPSGNSSNGSTTGTGTSGNGTPSGPGNPLPTPSTDPGGTGVIVIGYNPDPDPTNPPDTTPGGSTTVVTDPTTPTTPIDPTTVVVTDPTTPPDTTPTDPTTPIAGDPGTTPGGPDPGTTPPDTSPTDPTVIAGDPGTTPGGTPPSDPTVGPDPTTTPTGTSPTDATTIAGDPGTTPPDSTTPGGPTGGTDPTSTPSDTSPTDPTTVAGDPGTTPPGSTTPGGPTGGTDPTTTPTGTSSTDPTTVAGDPGTTPPSSTTPGGSTGGTDPTTTPTDTSSTGSTTVAGNPSNPSGNTTGSTDSGNTGGTTATTGSTDSGNSGNSGGNTNVASTGGTTGGSSNGTSDAGGNSTTSGSTSGGGTTTGSTDTSGNSSGGGNTNVASTGGTTGGSSNGTTDAGGNSTTSGSPAGGGTTTGSTDTSGNSSGSGNTNVASTGGTTGRSSNGTTDAGGNSTTSGSPAGGGTTSGSTDTSGNNGGSNNNVASTGGTTTGSSDSGGTGTSNGNNTIASAAGSSTGGGTSGGTSDGGNTSNSSASGGTSAGSGNSANGPTDSGGTGTAPAGTGGSSGSAAGGSNNADGTAPNGNSVTTASTATSAGEKSNDDAVQTSADCPQGSSRGKAGGACGAAGNAGKNGKSVTAPVVASASNSPSASTGPNTTAAAGQTPISPVPASFPAKGTTIAASTSTATQNAARALNATSTSSSASSQLITIQGDGVNLYEAGRRNGPGTPDPRLRH